MKSMKYIIENWVWKCIRKFGIKVHYTKKIGNKFPWVYLSYIPEACYRMDPVWLNGHQARREMKRMVEVFNSLGYNVYVSSYNNVELPDIEPKVVLGIEPAFEKACKRWPQAKKIYYATGASFQHQNFMIKKRTDEFNKKYDVNPPFPYQRMVHESKRYEMADYIFQIGSSFTIETYSKAIRSKIKLIRQSSTITEVSGLSFSQKKKNTFLWMGGAGPILKGLDLVLEYFRKHTELTLHVVGFIDDYFIKIIEADRMPNVLFHGYLNTSSLEFKKIVQEATYLIYPSCTEGCPGAVINSMYYGLIPIVTKWAAFDEINSCGFLIKDLTVESIADSINQALELDDNMQIRYSQMAYQYVSSNYTLDIFEKDLKIALKHIL